MTGWPYLYDWMTAYLYLCVVAFQRSHCTVLYVFAESKHVCHGLWRCTPKLSRVLRFHRFSGGSACDLFTYICKWILHYISPNVDVRSLSLNLPPGYSLLSGLCWILCPQVFAKKFPHYVLLGWILIICLTNRNRLYLCKYHMGICGRYLSKPFLAKAAVPGSPVSSRRSAPRSPNYLAGNTPSHLLLVYFLPFNKVHVGYDDYLQVKWWEKWLSSAVRK